jgi:hypothetical protein
MLKRGIGRGRPVWKTASGDYYFRGWTPPRSNTRGLNICGFEIQMGGVLLQFMDFLAGNMMG